MLISNLGLPDLKLYSFNKCLVIKKTIKTSNASKTNTPIKIKSFIIMSGLKLLLLKLCLKVHGKGCMAKYVESYFRVRRLEYGVNKTITFLL